MNRVNLAGYLADDPKALNSSNTPGARIKIAVKDLRGQETHFIECVAWAQTANYVLTYLKRGDFVTVDGRLTVRSYVNAEGKKVSPLNITVDVLRSGGKNSSSATFNNPSAKGASDTKQLANEVASLDEAFPETVDLNLDNAFGVKEVEPNQNEDNNESDEEKVSWFDDLED